MALLGTCEKVAAGIINPVNKLAANSKGALMMLSPVDKLTAFL
jgi:hypothetical protein